MGGRRINRIDVASGRKTVLLEKRSFLFSPDLSPDGHWVAFQAEPLSPTGGSNCSSPR